jgi:hypothetical protein
LPGQARNIAVVSRNNPFAPCNSSPVQSVPIVNPDPVEPTVEETTLKELKVAYKELEKNKKNLIEFIQTSRPGFIDPYLQLWNIWAVENKKPTVKAATKTRISHLNARLREKEFDFIQILAVAKKSKLIIEGDWFSFDWFTKSETNYLKVLEGNYNSKGTSEDDNDKTPFGY